MMKKYLLVQADMNDGDYTMQKSEITDEELKIILPIIEEIKKEKGYNWPSYDNVYEKYKGILSDQQIEIFNDYVPYGERGVHSIVSIELLTVTEEVELL